MIRVLVTDDSAFMRKLLSNIINSDDELEVIAVAKNGEDLLEKLPIYKPDVVTLDISMPVMDGVEALKRIMDKHPLPVIMISALSDEENTFKCLEIGAVDFIPKTSGIISIDMGKKKEIIIQKIKVAYKARVNRQINEKKIDDNLKNVDYKKDYIIGIGASTGGPKAIESIITQIPEDFKTPILIVQHIPMEFTFTFARRLNKLCACNIKEAQADEIIMPGTIYIAPGGFHLRVEKKKKETFVRLSKEEPINGMRPSIDITFESIAKEFNKKAVGVILTGMGCDGTYGLGIIKKQSGFTIAQEESTCVVPGMPRKAIEAKVIDRIVPLESITKELICYLDKKNG
jgi:two-component system, chemotaxis family, protein-glutamate methylesterase/glutaminase